jgi:hypothetical protein
MSSITSRAKRITMNRELVQRIISVLLAHKQSLEDEQDEIENDDSSSHDEMSSSDKYWGHLDAQIEEIVDVLNLLAQCHSKED